MPLYAYDSLFENKTARGTISSDNDIEARSILRSQGHTITGIRLKKDNIQLGKLRFKQRYSEHTIRFVRELSTLLAVGIPLLESIDTILMQHKGAFKNVLLSIRSSIAQGQSLAVSMSCHRHIFDDLSLNIVEVGENSGSLDVSLARLADFKESSSKLKNRVASSLMYPCMVFLTGIVICVFLMTFVVPSLLESLEELNKEPPLSTYIVKTISDVILEYWHILILFLIGSGTLFLYWISTDSGKNKFDKTILNVPVLNELIRKQAVVKISLIISTLLKSGVPFIKSLQVAQGSISNTVLRDALKRCEKSVQAGANISDAFDGTKAFSPLVTQVFSAGQASGKLDEMLERLSNDYDQQVATSAQRFTSLIEPILILSLAVMVGFIAFATFMPILEAGNVL